MKGASLAAIVIALGLLVAPEPAYALEDWCAGAGDTMCDWMNETWDGSGGSGGGGGDSTTTLCTKDYCFACALDGSLTKSVCYRLYSIPGYCTCTGTNKVFTDEAGTKWPRCATSGSCRYRR